MPLLPLKKLVVFRSSLFRAFDDCERGRCSYSKGPIEVFRTENDEYQLLDGYHRLIEYLATQKHLTNSHTIPIKVRTGPYTLDYAVANFDERWEYDGNLKYGNLEDLADEEIIDELSENLSDKFVVENNKNHKTKVLYHGSAKHFNYFAQKPWKAFDGKTILSPVWLTPDKKFAKINAEPNGWVYTVETNIVKTFPEKSLRKKKGRYIVPTEYGEKLLNDMVFNGMFGLDENDWHEAEEILKSIDRLDYDVLETGDFVNWLKENGYDSFLVKGDGPTNIAILNAENIKILDKEHSLKLETFDKNSKYMLEYVNIKNLLNYIFEEI